MTQVFAEIGAMTFGTVLLVAAVSKLDSWAAWTGTAYVLIRRARLRRIVAVGVPAIELIVGIATYLRPPVGLIGAAVLLFAFAVGVTISQPRARDMKCNCFGTLMPTRIGPGLAVRNLLLALLAGGAAGAARSAEAPSLTPLEILVSLMVAFIVVIVAELLQLYSVGRSGSFDESEVRA